MDENNDISEHVLNNVSILINEIMSDTEIDNHYTLEGVKATLINVFTDKFTINCQYTNGSLEMELFIYGVKIAFDYLKCRDLLNQELKIITPL